MCYFCQSHVHRFLSIFLIIFLVVPSKGLQGSITHQQTPECGTWSWEISEKDKRITVKPITNSSDVYCHGSFSLSNDTDLLGFGGYTLELDVHSNNADILWQPVFLVHGDPFNKVDLLPPLITELHAVPRDTSLEVPIIVQGDMTLRSYLWDVDLFLLRTALALKPPGTTCVIPEELLAFVALRTSTILGTTVGLAFKGNFIGAKKEFLQIAEEFYGQAAESLAEIGLDCGADILKSVIKKPLEIVKIGVAYLTWVPVAIFDYFKYQGEPINILFKYMPSYSPTPTFTPKPSLIPTQPLAPTVSPTLTCALPYADVSVDQANCRYGPGKAYLYADALFRGDRAEVHGRSYSGSWLYIQLEKDDRYCWASTSTVQVECDLSNVQVVSPNLPHTTETIPPTGVNGTRSGSTVTITWDQVHTNLEDARGYLIEASVCQNGQRILMTVQTDNLSYEFVDEKGCSGESGGRIYAVNVRGYTDPVPIPWP